MDDVTTRIGELLAFTGLSNKEFSEKIGVSPAIISHVLSGRNKPSLTVIQSILEEFTNVNSRYLLSGQGTLFTEVEAGADAITDGSKETEKINKLEKDEVSDEKSKVLPPTTAKPDSVKTASPEETSPSATTQGTFPGMANDGVRYVNPPGSTPLPAQSSPQESPTPENSPEAEAGDKKAAPENSSSHSHETPGKGEQYSSTPTSSEPQANTKKVVRIVFFYQDHTFEEYRP